MKTLEGQSILVTGGSGSFGNAFVRKVLALSPKRVIVYSRGEQLQETMSQTISDHRVRYFIGDVRDRERLEIAMHGVDVVVHAAAMKIVHIAEYNPYECIQTNITGAENICRAAIASGVTRVVGLSTDKAVNPLNLYGATKLAAEKIFVAANNMAAGRCDFSVCRYGNVLGSRGSVVPFFRSIIADGKGVFPITDPRMTRFWMTLDQAVELVISSLGMMHGREIFIPKLPSVRIVDLAKAMEPSYALDIVGIRPGEKLHEVLLTEDEARLSMEAYDRYIVNGGPSNVVDQFRYSSDNNKILTVDEIRKYL